MPTRRDVLRWASVAPLALPQLTRALPTTGGAPTPGPLPSLEKLAANLQDSLAAVKQVPLTNADAPDLVPDTWGRATSAVRR